MKRLLCVMFLLSVSTTVLAGVNSSENLRAFDSGPVYFNGGIVNPNSTFRIILTKKELIPGRYYRISCDIRNTNYNKKFPVVMNMSAPGSISLNDKNLGQGQGILDRLINKYIIPTVTIHNDGVYSPITMSFENYDTSDSVTIENCMATYATH